MVAAHGSSDYMAIVHCTNHTILSPTKSGKEQAMKTVLTRMNRLLNGAPRREREEAYLNGATSIVDLEMRMREIDSGKFKTSF
jgi:hypothetical protein